MATQEAANPSESPKKPCTSSTWNGDLEHINREEDIWEDEDDAGDNETFCSPITTEFSRNAWKDENRRSVETPLLQTSFSRRLSDRFQERFQERRRSGTFLAESRFPRLSFDAVSPVRTPRTWQNSSWGMAPTPTTPSLPKPSAFPKAALPNKKPSTPAPADDRSPFSHIWEQWSQACHTILVVLGVSAPSEFMEEALRSSSAPTGFVQPNPSTASASYTTNTDAATAGGTPPKASPSLWNQLMEEVLLTSNESMQEFKWERVSNFIAMPVWIEKLMCIGVLVSLNAYLYMVTILPLRFVVSWIRWGYNTLLWFKSRRKLYLNVSNKCDILKGLLVIQTCYILSRIADASKMYHSVRGQDTLKLSVIFSVLEISDRLCSSFGQDVLDTLFSRRTLARRSDGSHAYLRIAGYYTLCLAYIVFHTFVLLYQLVTLNVAINSYDNQLLTLLLSNQFVEIKTTVFKRFEKENLFQLACADIVERFQLCVVLAAIGLRNLLELSGAFAMGGTGAMGPLPTSFELYPYVNVFFRTLNPVLTVLLSEVLVDWLKHAFIAKQNHLRPALYGRFVDVLCRDILPPRSSVALDGHTHRQSSFVDQSPLAIRRLGLAVLPLVCVSIRMTSQIVSMLLVKDVHTSSDPQRAARVTAAASSTAYHQRGWLRRWTEQHSQACMVCLGLVFVWLALVLLKLLLGAYLVSYAMRQYTSWQGREAEEKRNAKGRPPIGETPAEMVHNAQVADMVDKRDDNATKVGLYGQQQASGRGAKKGDISLLDVQRYSLVGSRLW